MSLLDVNVAAGISTVMLGVEKANLISIRPIGNRYHQYEADMTMSKLSRRRIRKEAEMWELKLCPKCKRLMIDGKCDYCERRNDDSGTSIKTG